MKGNHESFMRRALELADKGRGRTAPNPCVGSVLVRDGNIVAEGWHTACGQLHAEREALADAQRKGVDPSRCDMYVTLEPCNHHGKTPPCTEGILEAGVQRVFVGAMDPNPKAAGGADYLRSKGMEVTTGILEQECLDSLDDFLLWQRTDRTYNILKMAQTLDGRIAGRDVKPVKVTGPEAHQRVQQLRARVDAVMVGGTTLRADNPRLNCRLDAAEGTAPKKLLAIIVTSRLPKADACLYLLENRAEETIFWTTLKMAESAEARALQGLGCKVWGLSSGSHGLDLAPAFQRLHKEESAHYTLCEGGGGLAMSLVKQGLADDLHSFIAPRILGDTEAVSVFSGSGETDMARTANFRVIATGMAGDDVFIRMRPKG